MKVGDLVIAPRWNHSDPDMSWQDRRPGRIAEFDKRRDEVSFLEVPKARVVFLSDEHWEWVNVDMISAVNGAVEQLAVLGEVEAERERLRNERRMRWRRMR